MAVTAQGQGQCMLSGSWDGRVGAESQRRLGDSRRFVGFYLFGIVRVQGEFSQLDFFYKRGSRGESGLAKGVSGMFRMKFRRVVAVLHRGGP